MSQVPGGLRETLLELHGIQGEAWLERLPALLKYCETRWSLNLKAPFQNLTYHYVAPASGPSGARWVLKAGYPNPELISEIEALRLFDGQGAVRLIEADAERGLLLLEELVPGTPLVNINNELLANSIAAQVMQQIRRPIPEQHNFRRVADWAKGLERLRRHFNGGSGPLPPDLVDRAQGLFDELLASTEENMLLHGDLHHSNILASERQAWLAIDPKGVIGDPAYEVSAYMINPVPQLLQNANPERLLRHRADQLAEELELDRLRLTGWSFAQAMLSAWWAYEDHGHGWEYFITCAELLARIH